MLFFISRLIIAAVTGFAGAYLCLNGTHAAPLFWGAFFTVISAVVTAFILNEVIEQIVNFLFPLISDED